jgi:hypothetical protein
MSLTAILNGETQSAPRDNTQLLDHCDHHAAQSITGDISVSSGRDGAQIPSERSSMRFTHHSRPRHDTATTQGRKQTTITRPILPKGSPTEASLSNNTNWYISAQASQSL